MKGLFYAKYPLVVSVTLATWTARPQTEKSQPVVDSAAQASPIVSVLNTPATDTSAEASPTDPTRSRSGPGIPPHTTLHVVLTEGVDSGSLKNGQIVRAKVKSANSAAVKAGTPVLLTVVGSVPAGKLNAVGEISLELIQVGARAVYTNVLTYRGQPGHRDLPDSAPLIGTNAGLPSGMDLTFVVQPAPSFTESNPGVGKFVPGSVTAHVSGSKPPNYGQPAVSSAPGSGVDGNGAPVSNTGGTSQPAESDQNSKPAPNQMLSPANKPSASTTQPR